MLSGSMSVPALRHLMGLMKQELHQFMADSFYEVLLNAKVHVPMQGNELGWVFGPGGQRALPIYLDEEALTAGGGSESASRLFSVPQAAAMAAHVKDAWLAVDFGSPLNQPIARAGVEALSNKSYPGAERYAEQWALVNQLAAALRQGRADPAIKQRAEQLGFYTIGEALGATNPAPGQVQVFESRGLSILSTRGPDGQSYVPGWPSPGGSFEYLPTQPHRLVVPLERLVQSALATKRGLVLGLPVPYVTVPFQRLAAFWA
jgi:hypothetical protein